MAANTSAGPRDGPHTALSGDRLQSASSDAEQEADHEPPNKRPRIWPRLLIGALVPLSATFVPLTIPRHIQRWFEPAAVHTFINDGALRDPADDSSLAFAVPKTRHVFMEVKRVEQMWGVWVAEGSYAEAGDFLGCYGGVLVTREYLMAKVAVAPSVDDYIYDVNDTHYVDPTGFSGRMDDTKPPFRTEMALVNEPTNGAPNVTPLDYAFGLCRDRHGALGVPYFATKRIQGGAEVTTCYGSHYRRAYRSDFCSNHARDANWAKWSLGVVWNRLPKSIRERAAAGRVLDVLQPSPPQADA